MKRVLSLVLLMSLIASAAYADPLTLAEPLTGEAWWPEDADASTADAVYRYAYPQVEGEDDAAEAINAFYSDMLSYDLYFRLPISGDFYDGIAETLISYEITCNNDEYFSVRILTCTVAEETETEIVSGHVFARHSEKPGNVITLPYLLGILEGGEDDTWLQDRQTAKAEDCVRRMLWEGISESGIPLLEDADEELLEAVFYPENDFYLNENGDPVFFLQPGRLFDESYGVVTFAIPLEELLDEI